MQKASSSGNQTGVVIGQNNDGNYEKSLKLFGGGTGGGLSPGKTSEYFGNLLINK